MEKMFGRSLAARQFSNYLASAQGKYVYAHSEGTLLLARAASALKVQGVDLKGATFDWNAPVIFESTARNIASSVGAISKYHLNWNDPIGVFTTYNLFQTATYGIVGIVTFAKYHGGAYYNNQ